METNDYNIIVTTKMSLLDNFTLLINSDTHTKKKKKIKFIVHKVAMNHSPVPTATFPPRFNEQFVIFQKKMDILKHHEIWRFKQASRQKHTRTRVPGHMTRGGEQLTLGSNGTEPMFTNNGIRGSSYLPWLSKTKMDYFKLYELGDPLIPQNKGGLKWEDILKHIYNSGEMEELRKKNGFNPKLKQDVFFPSGKTDSGRCVSQFLNRLWFIVNKC